MGRITLSLLFSLASLAGPGEVAAAPRPFDLAEAAPVFTGPASVAFRERRWADAARLFEEFLATPRPSKGAAAQLLAGLARARAGEPQQALGHLQGLHTRLAELTPYLRYHTATQLQALERPEEALAELAAITEATPLDESIRLLRAELLVARQRPAEAAELLRPATDQPRPRVEVLTLAARLARDLQQPDAAAALERRLWLEYPLAEAAQRLAPPDSVTADERLRRGRALYEANRHDPALDELKLALEGGAPPATACTARFLRGHTLFKARRHREAVAEFEQYFQAACPPTADHPEKARALYYAARASYRNNQVDLSLRYYDRLVAEAPTSNLADDALILKAEVLTDQRRLVDARQALEQVIARFQQGDMYEEAWWRLAWSRYRAGEPNAALKVLDRALRAGVQGQTYFSRGRLRYWQARLQGREKRTRPQAIATYRQIIRDWPLGYYAQLAANRLRATDPRHLKGLPLSPGQPRTWVFPHRPLFESPGFRRGLLLLTLGLGPEAQQEFEAAGLFQGDQPEERWLGALLFEQAGFFQRSHAVARRQDFQRARPDDAHVAEWRVAYPRAFATEAEAAARQADIPLMLLFGLMREESGFAPDVVSYAHAVGLTQLLVSTAQRMAEGLPNVGPVTEATLQQPARNLQLGARYLRRLLDRFHPLLAIAGYNAGETAARRWLDQWPDLAPDELVENIPYEQTRDYVKRVTESYGRYRFLYGTGPERFLVLPLGRDRADLGFEEASKKGDRGQRPTKQTKERRRDRNRQAPQARDQAPPATAPAITAPPAPPQPAPPAPAPALPVPADDDDLPELPYRAGPDEGPPANGRR